MPPYGGILVADKLPPSRAIGDDEELRLRSQQLAAFIGAKSFTGYMLGDFTKGGREATAEEQVLLGGTTEDGIPRGLTRCPACSGFKGTCLDPSETFRGQVMRVHCHCDNWNRCARCGETLAEWRLNANYYDTADNQIWHVPGFCGLSHKCKSATPAESAQT